VSFLAAGERAAVTAKARVYRGRLLAPSDYLRLLELETVGCPLYTTPSPRDLSTNRMPSAAW